MLWFGCTALHHHEAWLCVCRSSAYEKNAKLPSTTLRASSSCNAMPTPSSSRQATQAVALSLLLLRVVSVCCFLSVLFLVLSTVLQACAHVWPWQLQVLWRTTTTFPLEPEDIPTNAAWHEIHMVTACPYVHTCQSPVVRGKPACRFHRRRGGCREGALPACRTSCVLRSKAEVPRANSAA